MMFGANPTLKREQGAGWVLDVHEIFYTIQGEGPHAGVPAVFIRLFGCHLKCTWCDTDFSTQNHMYVEEILSRIEQIDRNPPSLIVLTGGEPTRQPIDNLVSSNLLLMGHKVQIETAGSFFRDCMIDCDVVVSPKTSFVHRQVAKCATAYKYVISADMPVDIDGLPVTDTQATGRLRALAKPPPGVPVYLSPMDEYDATKNQLNMNRVSELCMAHGYRMGVQLHKLVGLP